MISCKPGLISASNSAQGPRDPQANPSFYNSFPHIVQKSPVEGDWELGFHLLTEPTPKQPSGDGHTITETRCDQLNIISQLVIVTKLKYKGAKILEYSWKCRAQDVLEDDFEVSSYKKTQHSLKMDVCHATRCTLCYNKY